MAITPLQPTLETFFNGLCCTTIPPGVAPTISYPIALPFTEGVAVNYCPDVLTGDLPITVTISPALPAGLSINATTGCISGTPTASSPSTSYTVTATNAFGNDTDVILIQVNAAVVPITITNGGFGTALAAQTYLNLYSSTYTNFNYDVTNDIMSWVEPAGTSYTAFQFMTAPVNGLATGATFSDPNGLITSFGFKAFQKISTDHTFANNITFGTSNFHALNANLTFGDNCSFGESTLDSPFGTNNTINFGHNSLFNATTTNNLNGFNNCTFNFGSINNIVTRLGISTDCTYNFNGSIGNTTGADFTNPDWIDVTSTGAIINARTFDQTSNGSGIEGDLDNLINNGFTVNFTL
jgi:hypothetical protein